MLKLYLILIFCGCLNLILHGSLISFKCADVTSILVCKPWHVWSGACDRAVCSVAGRSRISLWAYAYWLSDAELIDQQHARHFLAHCAYPFYKFCGRPCTILALPLKGKHQRCMPR